MSRSTVLYGIKDALPKSALVWGRNPQFGSFFLSRIKQEKAGGWSWLSVQHLCCFVVAQQFMEVFQARLDGAWSTLGWWKVSLPIAGVTLDVL